MSDHPTRALVLGLALLGAAPANALTSYVNLNIRFLQNNGGFCPTTRNCSGSYYTQTQFGVNRPLRSVRVYLMSGATIIGQGVTNTGGQTVIGYFWPPPDQLNNKIVVKFEEGNGRWVVRTLTGGVNQREQAVGMLPYAPNPGSPTLLYMTIGTPSVPDDVANLFDVAQKGWANGLSQSSSLQSLFTGVSIRGFSDPEGTDCPTSCAFASTKIIKISMLHRFSMVPMHEMGHIANYLSHGTNSFSYGGCYDYPTECTGFPGSAGGVWYPETVEWSSASFEEGLATFAAAAGYYSSAAPVPYTCDIMAAACTTSQYDVEKMPSCPAGAYGFPINVTRYFWDLYDTTADSESVALPLSRIYSNLGAFPEGNANGAEDEPLVPLNQDENGRSLFDYRKYDGVTATVWSNNCSPSPGD
ncbi:MAG: hypothetical protein A2138_24910 [Deltaproteobacteria bacterium RBG_16_71_12]|nr:MAG: hypothetical protein A2138_24910 [Deltaproteobacteria bacterium RBG_16_71_12]